MALRGMDVPSPGLRVVWLTNCVDLSCPMAGVHSAQPDGQTPSSPMGGTHDTHLQKGALSVLGDRIQPKFM